MTLWRMDYGLEARDKVFFVSVTGYLINKTHNFYSGICEIKQIPLNLSKVFGKMVYFLLLMLFIYLY